MIVLVDHQKEFEYSQEDFINVKSIIHNFAGISLSDHKIQLVYSRLAPRLRAKNINRFADYLTLIDKDENEFNQFINSLTTNKTDFFRESHHFDFLSKEIIPCVFKKKKSLKIWSAGCSTGEEPYTIAMSVFPYLKFFDNNIKILATDLDTKVLSYAKAGIYDNERVSGVESKYLRDFFLKGKKHKNGKVKINDSLKKIITFKRLNLMDEWSFRGLFDVIFCRNVIIYFDKNTQKELLEKYCRYLQPNGWLILGHSESLGKNQNKFDFLGKTIYQKKL